MDPSQPRFAPVPVRHRVDGWTPERQVAFIEALAATGNVEAAAKAVGKGTASVYALRARLDAAAFREAWRRALDFAVERLAEAALDRAINGVVTPVFYKGEQVGERRRHDERLAMFILRMRDPRRFGGWREDRVPFAGPDDAATRLRMALARLEESAHAAAEGRAPAALAPVADAPLLPPENAAIVDRARSDRLIASFEETRDDDPDGTIQILLDRLATIERGRKRIAEQKAGAAETDLEGGT